MRNNNRSVVIIGAGIAGLSAAVYALQCGYDVEVVEMNSVAGGLAMSWKRGPYTFETCLHWLLGSRPGGELHQQWRELFAIEQLAFVDPEEFLSIEGPGGEVLHIYARVDRLEEELLRCAPQDEAAIRDLTHAIRALGTFRLLDPSESRAHRFAGLLHDLPMLPLLKRIAGMSGEQYGARFKHPLLRRFFSDGDMGKLSAIAIVFTLAWMNVGNAAYCIGGSQAIIRLLQERLVALGGCLRFNSRVERIVVENDRAIGVQFAGGDILSADWVLSAADGHSTIFDMLGGHYTDSATHRLYTEHETFASYLQVSFGIARDLSGQPPMVTRVLDQPLIVDPSTTLETLGFRFFHFDPTFAPPGKIAVTSLLPTRNFEYWVRLRNDDPDAYRNEKQRLADAVLSVLEQRIPGVRSAVEIIDVSSPATVLRYTGNWKGSQEGWIIRPGDTFRPLPSALPGLDRFSMVGQWISPGGGLPSGPMTARPVIKEMCRRDRVPFKVHIAPAETSQPVPV